MGALARGWRANNAPLRTRWTSSEIRRSPPKKYQIRSVGTGGERFSGLGTGWTISIHRPVGVRSAPSVPGSARRESRDSSLLRSGSEPCTRLPHRNPGASSKHEDQWKSQWTQGGVQSITSQGAMGNTAGWKNGPMKRCPAVQGMAGRLGQLCLVSLARWGGAGGSGTDLRAEARTANPYWGPKVRRHAGGRSFESPGTARIWGDIPRAYDILLRR